MNILLKGVSAAGLALTVMPACFVWAGAISWDTHAMLMLIGTLMWFGSAPFWMKKDNT